MTRSRKRLLEDFIIPSLDSGKYGSKMQWVNKGEGIFRIYWSHKNAAKWTKEDTEVFQDWDRLKGHYKPSGKSYFMCAKQRFRAALYKLHPYVKSLENSIKYHRDYQLTSEGKKKRDENSERPKTKLGRKTSQSAIPTSVIQRNTSYIAKPVKDEKKPMPPKPGLYAPSDLQILAQYSCAMQRMNVRKMARRNESSSPVKSTPDNYRNHTIETYRNLRQLHEASVLRENTSAPRIPHVAPQPVPVYCSYKQNSCNNYQDCPEVFVSKIYNGPENVPESKDDALSSGQTSDDDTSSGILNLSLRSDTSSNPPSR